MLSWLFEGRLTPLLVLAALLILALVLWWQRRERSWLITVGILAALLGLYLLLDLVVETEGEADRRQVRERLTVMTEAVGSGSLEALFRHISPQFRSPKGLDREQLRSLAQRYLQSGFVTEVTTWDLRFEEGFSRANGRGQASFSFKVKGSALGAAQEGFFRCEATFAYSASQGWELVGVRILYPERDEEVQQVPF